MKYAESNSEQREREKKLLHRNNFFLKEKTGREKTNRKLEDFHVNTLGTAEPAVQ
jgi:hypothetical protein